MIWNISSHQKEHWVLIEINLCTFWLHITHRHTTQSKMFLPYWKIHDVCEKLWIFIFCNISLQIQQQKINCCSLRQVNCETWSWLCLMATHLLCHLFMQSHKHTHTHGKETISKTVRDVSYINLRLDWISFIVQFCVSPCFKM